MDATAPLLVDSSGNALISEESLPIPRVLTNAELTAFVAGMTRFLTTIFGPEAAQLIAMHAMELERELGREARESADSERRFKAAATRVTGTS
jgi:hypothetical protein